MIKLYNSLSHQKEAIIPQGEGKLKMFVCGPTVYDYIHIGNARTFVIFDTIAKYLRYRDYELYYLQNITDIDDKIINRAQADGISPLDLARGYEARFLEDADRLKITAVDHYARATQHIPEIIQQVITLKASGHAYLIEGDGYYFDTSTFADSGKLSVRTAEMANGGVSRRDESTGKRNRADFNLWKLAKPGEPSWLSEELGEGRPGWHIEDTAITEKHLGTQYDIHGGGQDLIFPHHEAEIAQQESASGQKPFVRYWLHSGFLINKSEKMSKSLGNFTTVHDLLDQYSPETLRFYFLSAHYRSPLDYSPEILHASQAATQRLAEFMRKLESVTGTSAEPTTVEMDDYLGGLRARIIEALDDDFNTPAAFGQLFEALKELNPSLALGTLDQKTAQQILDLFREFDAVLGILPTTTSTLPNDIEQLVTRREAARANKDFTQADALRAELESHGYRIEDTPYGPLAIK